MSHKKIIFYILGIFIFISVFISVNIISIINPVFFINKKDVSFIKADSLSLNNHVSYLSNLSPSRSFPNIESLNNSAKYIQDNFSKYCESTEEQVFKVEDKEYKNIICSFNLKSEERIVVGAHYDSFGGLPGADDNASGVAGILELAKMLSVNKPILNNRLDIVAYSLEEKPNFDTNNMGSLHHVNMLKENNEKVKLAIVLEMIGYYSDKKNSQSFPNIFTNLFYPSKGNFILIVSKSDNLKEIRNIKKIFIQVMDMKVYSYNEKVNEKEGWSSDHSSYLRNKIPAIMITDTLYLRNKNYHTERDTPNTLDYNRMAEVVNGTYNSVINL